MLLIIKAVIMFFSHHNSVAVAETTPTVGAGDGMSPHP